jgi:hypothetical protein
VYQFGNITTPSYRASVVWGQFGNLGPGVPADIVQGVASVNLPKYTLNNVPELFDVIIRGQFGLALSGWSSGSGSCAATAVFKSYNYGLGSVLPNTAEYYIADGGMAELYVTQTLEEGGQPHYEPFTLRLVAPESNGGVTVDGSGVPHVQWGFEILNAIEQIQLAGPFDQNGFMTVHRGVLSGHFLNVTYELVPRGTPVLGIPESCELFGLSPVPVLPTDAGTDNEASFDTGALVYELGQAYVPGSVAVWVGGNFVGSMRLTPLTDYVETNYLRGTVSLMYSPTGPIHITWQALGLAVPDG